MLSDSPKLKGKKLRQNPVRTPRDGVRRWYSDSQKLEVVRLWLVTGNLQATAAALNIPLTTVKEWRYSKWWEELVTDIKTEGTIQLSNKLKNIAEKALHVTLDRLENGDWIYDQKTGEMRRKGIPARDAYAIAAGMLDRQMKLDEKPQTDENNQKIQDRLSALATAFSSFAKKTTKIEVIDVEENYHSLHDQRQARLQEGVAVGKDSGQEPGLRSSQESPGTPGNGERDGEHAVFDARGSQETPEVWGFKLSEQLEVGEGEDQSSEGSPQS